MQFSADHCSKRRWVAHVIRLTENPSSVQSHNLNDIWAAEARKMQVSIIEKLEAFRIRASALPIPEMTILGMLGIT